MITVYKYLLEPTTKQVIRVPGLRSAINFKDQVLKLDVQYNRMCVWCMVDTDYEEKEVVINMYGTGHECNESPDSYIGTAVLRHGDLVLHVFGDHNG